jgi:hypothetical protein
MMDKRTWWAFVACMAVATLDAAAIFWVTGERWAAGACFVIVLLGLMAAIGLTSRLD